MANVVIMVITATALVRGYLLWLITAATSAAAAAVEVEVVDKLAETEQARQIKVLFNQ